MKLSKIDDRHPVTKALSYGYTNRLISNDDESKLKSELLSLLIESAEKFGFEDVDSMRKTLDFCLGLLSLGLCLQTNGKTDEKAWFEIIQEKGLEQLVLPVVTVSRQAANESVYSNLLSQEGDVWTTPRVLLLEWATARNPKERNRWIGFSRMQSDLRSRKQSRAEEGLGKWLIQKFCDTQYDRWLLRFKKNHTYEGESLLPSEVTTNLLFRYCTGLPTNGNIELNKSDFDAVRADYEAYKKSWLATAKHRYEVLVEEIPIELRDALWNSEVQKGWFQIYLLPGPPKPPKKALILEPHGKFQGYRLQMFV